MIAYAPPYYSKMRTASSKKGSAKAQTWGMVVEVISNFLEKIRDRFLKSSK
jgi:hypothetical protein